LVAKSRKKQNNEEEAEPQDRLSIPSRPKPEPISYNPYTTVMSRTTIPYEAGYLYAVGDGNGDSCPVCETQVFYLEGCVTCPECGWGLCS